MIVSGVQQNDSFVCTDSFQRLFLVARDKESACNLRDRGDVGLVPGSGRALGEGITTHSSDSAKENPMD